MEISSQTIIPAQVEVNSEKPIVSTEMKKVLSENKLLEIHLEYLSNEGDKKAITDLKLYNENPTKEQMNQLKEYYKIGQFSEERKAQLFEYHNTKISLQEKEKQEQEKITADVFHNTLKGNRKVEKRGRQINLYDTTWKKLTELTGIGGAYFELVSKKICEQIGNINEKIEKFPFNPRDKKQIGKYFNQLVGRIEKETEKKTKQTVTYDAKFSDRGKKRSERTSLRVFKSILRKANITLTSKEIRDIQNMKKIEDSNVPKVIKKTKGLLARLFS